MMGAPSNYVPSHGPSYGWNGQRPAYAPIRVHFVDPARENGQDGDAQPPALTNVEAEACLLGAMMIDNRLIADTAQTVQPDDFFEPVHGRILSAMRRMMDRGREANPVTLRPIFENDPAMHELGGVSYLARLTGSTAALIGARDFAAQVAELAAYRKVRDALANGLERIVNFDDTVSIEQVSSQIDEAIWDATARSDPLRPRAAASSIRSTIDRASRIKTAGEPMGARCKSIPDLDEIIGPAEPGTFNIIGGRPGMAKTTLAVSAAWGYAATGTPVDYYHAEMTDEQMDMRVAADLSHAMGTPVPHKNIRKGSLSAAELRTLEQAAAMAEALPLSFTAVGRCNVRRIDSLVARSKARWAAKGRNLGVVFVDYIQLLQAEANGRPITDARARVSAVSGGLLDIAQKHKVALFGLCQLSRAVEDRKDHRPQLSDLKESGDLEQDADSVILLYREEHYLLKEQPRKGDANYERLRERWEIDFECARGKIELIGEKNRHGPNVTREARFYGPSYAIRGSDFNPYADDELLLAL